MDIQDMITELFEKKERVEKESEWINCESPKDSSVPADTKMPFLKSVALPSHDNGLDPSSYPADMEPPEDLIVYLTRFKKKSYTVVIKNGKPVTINKKIKVYDVDYYLSAVILHTGEVDGGHYICFAKRGNKGTWYRLDDERHRKLEDGELGQIDKSGYIFLYRKTENIDIKYDNGTPNNGNGIENIGNTCYFASALQLLITTDEYQNKNKMRVYKKNLYNFIKNTTEPNSETKDKKKI